MKKQTRREFLGNTIFAAAGAGLGLAALPGGSLLASAQKGGRGYTAARHVILLNGVMAGFPESVEGGNATSGVVENRAPGRGPQKHIAGVKYEDITVNFGTGMSRAFYDWIRATLERRSARMNGAISTCDFNWNEVERMEWSNGLITEVGFPALDAASKDAAKMTVKISPEAIRMVKGAGSLRGAAAQAVHKKWLPSNFRLNIDGLDCTRVNRIEAITVKQKVVDNPVGELRSPQRPSGQMAVSSLVVTLPESHAAAFIKWHEAVAIKGNNGPNQRKNGQLDYLTPDLRESLFALRFKGLSIHKLNSERVGAHNENIRGVRAEMSFEGLQFSYNAA
ncbi:MAG TPA: phage tail protein [Verrucomicrobiae bacterium]|jgi:hypothetical protein|nr:phage tail protein [Verrucomicrobiae bacterium]